MKCDKCKHTGREKAIQVGNTKICQECVNDAATKNNANAYVVNELLTYVDTYRHQSSKAKILLACLKFYADQDIIDAKYALYREFSDILGEPQPRLDSSNRTKAEKSLEDIYSALQALDECNETLNFVALNLKRVPNFSPEEIDLTSMLERLSKIERRVENVEETCSLTMVELGPYA